MATIPPTASEGVRATLGGRARQRAGRRRRQAQPLTDDALDVIRATACLPRRGRGGALEIPVNAENRGKVDIEAWDDGSGRLARRMTARGAPAADVMGQDCWASPAMIARYTRGETDGRAARYLA